MSFTLFRQERKIDEIGLEVGIVSDSGFESSDIGFLSNGKYKLMV